jgi:hypothetical protein
MVFIAAGTLPIDGPAPQPTVTKSTSFLRQSSLKPSRIHFLTSKQNARRPDSISRVGSGGIFLLSTLPKAPFLHDLGNRDSAREASLSFASRRAVERFFGNPYNTVRDGSSRGREA